jgi:hypothetical protein
MIRKLVYLSGENQEAVGAKTSSLAVLKRKDLMLVGALYLIRKNTLAASLLGA